MKNHQDTALSISNPRLLAGVYFALLAVIATCIVDGFLYFVGAEQFLPLFKATLLAVVIAGCFGAIFGRRIVYSQKPYRRKAFIYGFLMVLVALPFYVLGFLYLSEDYTRWIRTETLSQQILNYLFTLFYSFIFAGLWLAIAAGFAAMYLRGHVVYDILHSKYLRRR
ncbi:hypothetical protein [Legionella clemsonensis]|uniref:Uncharacterized protein n=1 Tax=Legionella clemsonensis TaxID=1867846 RepID=A0A222P481_9GAMM|nr:hypothetical protein [Legionella clemsonensis]ASQ46658.1 hypothetical protein clem_10560 [Legionella clemsonensis]